MDIPTVHLLLLEIVPLRITCGTFSIWCASLTIPTTRFVFSTPPKANLPVDGPRGSFTEYEWVLVQNNSPFTVCIMNEDITSPTPDPEPSQPAMPTAEMPELTADSQPDWP